MSRLARLVALSTCAVIVSSPLGFASADKPACATKLVANTWQQLRPSGLSGTVVDYSVRQDAPASLFATDGTSVVRSTNGGCSWTTVFSGGPGSSVSFSGTSASVTTPSQVLRVRAAATGSGVFVLLREGALDGSSNDPTPATVVESSTDDGETWVASPPFPGQPVDLAVSGADAVVAVRTTPDRRLADLYRTTDAGQQWTPAAAPVAQELQLDGLTMSALDFHELWYWSATGAYRSADLGTTFTQQVNKPVHFVSVSSEPTAEADVFLADGTYASAGPGGSLRLAGRLVGPTSSVSTKLVGELAIVVRGRLRLEAGSFSVRDITPSGAGTLQEVESAMLGNLQLLYVADRGFLWRLPLTSQGPTFTPPPPPVSLPVADIPSVPVVIPSIALRPSSEHITLRPGQSRVVPYQLDLPASPTPLDVMFLVDTTGSMDSTINGLRQGIGSIVDALAASRIDTQFGLGDFKDYPNGVNGDPGDYPYKRELPISPAGDSLAAGLRQLSAGGGGDGPESDLAALYYSTTGEGQEIVAGQPQGGYWVEPHQEAGYRPGALRVVVLATDTTFNVSATGGSGPDYPGPSWATTLAALTAAHVRVVGLDVRDGGGGTGDLRRVARGSGATAGVDGIDCNGDGTQDIGPGEPLVCPVTADSRSVNLAPAIVGLLRAIHDEAAVSIGVQSAPAIARLTKTGAFASVDLKAAHRLSTAVRFSCPKKGTGVHEVSVVARIRSREVARGAAELECALPDVPPKPTLPLPALPPAVVVVAAPAPPAQVPNANPNPQPNVQPNAQPQANPNPGAAIQDEEAPQLSLAHQEIEPAADAGPQTMAMSRSAAGWQTALLAVVACGGAAVVVRRRRRAEQVGWATARAD